MIDESPHGYPESRPPTADKASPTTCPAIKISGPQNPSELCRPETHAKIKRCTLSIQNAGIGDKGQGRRRKRAQDGSRAFAKQQRRRPNVDLDVVHLVLRRKKHREDDRRTCVDERRLTWWA